MIDYRPTNLPLTFGSVVIIGSILTAVDVNALNSYDKKNHDSILKGKFLNIEPNHGFGIYKYSADEEPNTYDSNVNIIAERSALVSSPIEFEEAIRGFYSKLTESQKPLGEQFETVLYANLWDLYES